MKRSRFQTGMTLIELMVALAIGMFLLIGAMTVFMQGRTTFRLTEAISRLQENGRFALDALEQDVRMAQYWGLTNRSEMIRGRATEAPIDVTLVHATLDDCGATWLTDLDNAIAAMNNDYDWPCGGNNPDEGANGSDSFVVRRVAEDSLTVAQVAAAPNNTLFVLSRRGGIDGRIFAKGDALADFDPATDELHQLVVNGYYVSTQSATSFPGANVPSLRMRTLVGGAPPAGPLQDRELIPGVEDMQVQFGIDTDAPGAPNRGAIDRYVDPEDPLLATSVILAMRVWLRIRAERVENGFVDETTYDYADEDATYDDNFRRVVVSKTIYLRNARL